MPDAADTRLADALARLTRLESEHAIRACVNRYMALCDALDADAPLDELAGLFTEDAIWRGKGARYAQSFGGHEGREAIRAMFATYASTPPHFAVNVHFLTSELIEVQAAGTARGSWVMLQTSTFSAGGSHLNAARLTLSFRREADGVWRIAEFVTENLFSRPVKDWNDSAPLPVPR